MSNDNFNQAFTNETREQGTARLLEFLKPSLDEVVNEDTLSEYEDSRVNWEGVLKSGGSRVCTA